MHNTNPSLVARETIGVTVLADNSAATSGVSVEHGLSFRIDTGRGGLLFDTGQGLVLSDNAAAMGIDLSAVDTIVLSHGHYDHTGGLTDVLRRAVNRVTVHAHPDSLLPKYVRGETGVRDIGMPAECRKAMLDPRCRFKPSWGSVEIVPGIRTTGEIPRIHPEEAINEFFCRDPAGCQADPLADDQALFMATVQGTVVLLGRAHSGVINTLDHVQALTDGKPVRAVVGGMHLRSATADRIAWTIRELHRFNLSLLVPLHCTGQNAVTALVAAFPGVCMAGGAGNVFTF